MITPTRFGLKYAPIPTLALEYEDDLRSIDDGATTSLYVYNGDNDKGKQNHTRRMKKLHAVELPALTKHSEAVAVARQLQQDNQRFLSPAVVKEDQLVRLLERLMAHLQATELSASSLPPAARAGGDNGASAGGGGSVAAMAGKFGSGTQDAGSGDEGDDNEQESESELEESAMDESIAEASASMDVSRGDDGKSDADDDDGDSRFKSTAQTRPEQHDGEDAAIATGKPAGDSELSPSQEARDQSKENDNGTSAAASTTKPSASASDDEDDAREAQDDAAKRKALRSESESEASDDNEEDIQSEELEYFSEDASDEDSF